MRRSIGTLAVAAAAWAVAASAWTGSDDLGRLELVLLAAPPVATILGIALLLRARSGRRAARG